MRLVRISRKYNIPPELFRFSADPNLQKEIREVLKLVREALYDKMLIINTFEDDENEGEKYIPPLLTDKDNGKTLKERIAIYTERWGYEAEAIIAAAGLEKITDIHRIHAELDRYMFNPYLSPMFQDHMGEGIATRLGEIPSYGKGRQKAAASALATLLAFVTARAWQDYWAKINRKYKRFYVYRGSSYDCDLCDSFVHASPHTNEANLPPYHPRCRCYVVYTNE